MQTDFSLYWSKWSQGKPSDTEITMLSCSCPTPAMVGSCVLPAETVPGLSLCLTDCWKLHLPRHRWADKDVDNPSLPLPTPSSNSSPFFSNVADMMLCIFKIHSPWHWLSVGMILRLESNVGLATREHLWEEMHLCISQNNINIHSYLLITTSCSFFKVRLRVEDSIFNEKHLSGIWAKSPAVQAVKTDTAPYLLSKAVLKCRACYCIFIQASITIKPPASSSVRAL